MNFSLERKNKKKFSLKKKSPNYRKAKQLRGTQRWKNLRSLFRINNPLCLYCKKAPTVEVHHIQPVAEFPELCFEESNLFPACIYCHEEIHKRMMNGEDLTKELSEKKEAYKTKTI